MRADETLYKLVTVYKLVTTFQPVEPQKKENRHNGRWVTILLRHYPGLTA